MTRFAFHFDHRFRAPLAAAGITPKTAWIEVDDDVSVRFGPWSLRTPLDNIVRTERSGPYRWYRAIGPHLSFTDRGVTFGTSTSGGLCVLFAEPVSGLAPFGVLRHPGMTVTPIDIDGLEAALRR